jgi:hypothetical protein
MPPAHVVGPEPTSIEPSMHVDGWFVVSVTLTVAVVAVIAVTEKLTPPAGSLYVEPAVMPLTGFVDGFMSMSTLRAQAWFG